MLARILPYIVFAVLLTIARSLSFHQAWGIIFVYCVTAVTLIYFWKSYEELRTPRASTRAYALGVLMGAVGITIWILPYHIWPQFHQTDSLFGLLGKNRPPLLSDQPKVTALTIIYILARASGYTLVTPLFEELFVRSFLIRYLINPRFTNVPLGSYTPLSFWGSALFFSLTHPEWIVAFIYAVLLNLLLYKTKSLRVCVVAHGTSNALLVVYVLMTGNWILW